MEDDRSFYERRLREELDRAGSLGDEGLKALHQRWAKLYRDRLDRLLKRGRHPLSLAEQARATRPRQPRI